MENCEIDHIDYSIREQPTSAAACEHSPLKHNFEPIESFGISLETAVLTLDPATVGGFARCIVLRFCGRRPRSR